MTAVRGKRERRSQSQKRKTPISGEWGKRMFFNTSKGKKKKQKKSQGRKEVDVVTRIGKPALFDSMFLE